MKDIVIYGGGIVGAACARDAALRGLSVKLIEKYDYASGASSKSSKLAHGGLRYLESLNFKLTHESLVERDWLLKFAPQMVKPLPFIFPIHKDARLKIKAGLSLYDLLSTSVLPKHKHVDDIPLIRSDIKEGYLYYDALLEDGRLVFANLYDAKQKGAVCENYSESTETGKVTINAMGPFSPLTAPTKGAHLVLPSIKSETAFILRAPQDNRVFFVIPWKGLSLVGTTDTHFKGNPSEVKVEQTDIDYLIEAFTYYFPSADTTIISSFAGLRPLIKTDSLSPSEVPRDHLIKVENNNISVVGGKYTTFRLIAEQTIDQACKLLNHNIACQTKTHPLIDPYPHTGTPLTPNHPYTEDDVRFAIKEEGMKSTDDWFFRRTEMGYTDGMSALSKVETILHESYNAVS